MIDLDKIDFDLLNHIFTDDREQKETKRLYKKPTNLKTKSDGWFNSEETLKSYKEKMRPYWDSLTTKFGKKVAQYTLDGKLIKVFDSIRKAEKETGVHSALICSVCKGRRDKTRGYKWEYIYD